ncbi:MAG: hypothetical protein ACRD6X_17255 [Pyrinomonadaceae bacterium]
MKNNFMKTIGATALAILMLTVFANIWMFAQDKTDEQSQEDFYRNGNARLLVGSWNVQITIRDCNSGTAFVSFPAMMTFNQGGTMQETANDRTPLLRLPGHGVWSYQRGRTFSRAFQFFRYNADGSYSGRNRIRGPIEVNRSGNRYTSTTSFEVLDPNDNVLDSGCATEVGTRFE